MEPGVEPARVAKPGKVPPGAHEGVLDHVVRELAVSDDQPGSGGNPFERVVNQP